MVSSLEWQFTALLWCGWCGRLCRWGGLRRSRGGWGGLCASVDDIPRLNLGKPLAFPFSPVKVKRGCHLLPDLQGELVYALTEELNGDLLWVLPARLKDEHLRLPRLACFGRALLEGEDLEHSPRYVYFIHIYVC